MRILSISAQKPDSTGSGVFLTETTDAFVRVGHEAAVVVGIAQGDRPRFAEGVKQYPVYFESPELPFPVVGMSDEMPYRATRYRDMDSSMVDSFMAAFQSTVRQAVEEFNPDLVICHHLYLLTALVRKLLSQTRVVAICHSTELRQMGKHHLERAAIIEGVRGLDAVLALHSSQKSEIIELFGIDEEKVYVIGTGYSDTVFCASECAAAASDKPINLVYAGKIWEKKGVPCLIRSLDLLPFDHQSLALRLAGGHATEDEYRSIKALGAGSQYSITFLGKLPQHELAAEYRAASVFVLPSFFEGLPLVVVEALACGCKVVVTDLPGIREWIDASIPNAPVVYVEPPSMINTDEPVEGSLPAFEARLADAIVRCFELPDSSVLDLSALSWEGLARRMLIDSFASDQLRSKSKVD